jgi:hypothetical protein
VIRGVRELVMRLREALITSPDRQITTHYLFTVAGTSRSALSQMKSLLLYTASS